MESHEDIQKKLHYYISKLRAFLSTTKSSSPGLEAQDNGPSSLTYASTLPSSAASLDSLQIYGNPMGPSSVQLPEKSSDALLDLHDVPANESEPSHALDMRSPMSNSLSPSEDALCVLMNPSARKEFELECRKHIPSYRLGHKSKRRTQNFNRLLDRKENSCFANGPLPSCPPWIEAAIADGQVSSRWVKWAGKRPAPLSSTRFLAALKGEQEVDPNDEEFCLMKNVNVAFYLTPASKKSGRNRPSLIPSLSLMPSTREFRSQSQLLLEEIAACLHLQSTDPSSPLLSVSDKHAGKKRKSSSKYIDPAELPSVLLETSREVYKRHYAAKLYDEVHYLPPSEICFSLSNGKASKKSSCHAGKDEVCTESFVLAVPSNIQSFIDWLRPGEYTLFLFHWTLLVALKGMGKGKGLLFTKLIPRSFLNAAKSWTVSSRADLRKFKVNLKKKRIDSTSNGILLAILPQSIPLLKQLFTCASLYHEAEKLQMVLSNLREHKLCKAAQQDTLFLLKTHEKDYKNLVVDKTHSRVSARIAAGKPLEGYKDTPSRYTDEDFSPALVHAIEERANLHAMEKGFEGSETAGKNKVSDCPQLTTQVLNGLHGTCMAKGDYRNCDLLLGAFDSRVHTLQFVDSEPRSLFLDTKQGKSAKEGDSWDAVDGATNNDYVNSVQSLYDRVDKYGFSRIIIRTDTLRNDSCDEIMRSPGEGAQQC